MQSGPYIYAGFASRKCTPDSQLCLSILWANSVPQIAYSITLPVGSLVGMAKLERLWKSSLPKVDPKTKKEAVSG